MSSKNFYGLTGDVTIDGGILNVSNIATIGTTKTFVVTVGGNGKYFIDGVDRPLLELHEHQTYKFDFSSSTLLAGGGHPFIFSETANGGAYTSGITTTGTYGSDEIRTFVVPTGAPSTLYYYCTNHSGMGARVSISPTAELVVAPLGQGRVVTDFVSSKRSLIRNVETIGTTKTFVVTVQQVNNVNKYHIDGVDRPLIELHEHQTYIFDITASNAGGHPFRLATSSTWANPNTDNYDNGVDLSDPDKFIFTVPAGAPTTLYYYCTQHSGMGATISISPESELIVSGRIVASGNVEASKITASTFVGDGSLLTGISTVTSSGLQVVTDNSPTTTNTIEFTNPTTSLRASSNIVATGNVTADHFVGDGSQLSGIVTSVSLGDAVNTGNITSNTVQFTNTSTSLTASGNVEVAGNVVTSGNVEAAYFIGDGSKLSGIVTSVTLGDAVDSGNTTSNTVQFTNTSTSLTASGNVEVTGNVVAGYFIGDGSQLTGLPSGGGGSGTSHWTKTSGTNELYYTAGSVGISNANPIHDLSVGSNLYVDDDATDGILKVTGNVNATYFVGDGSRLVNLPSGGGTSAWTTATGIIHYPQNPTTTSINVGIMNNTPQHTLSVGSNLFVDDTGSNVLVVDGDITAESMFLGALGIKPSYPLETVTDAGNVTPHTISFTNPTLGFITASNVEIGGELVIGKGTIGGSNLEVGEANLFVNTELTRVGIGTDQPAATLHVNGSLAVDGPLTFGTVDVAAQHGLEAITAVSNTTPLTIELQNADTSLVTTGNVEVGGELTVSGNAIVSSNLTVSGNTFYTSPMSISVDSNVVTEYTGPHDRPLRKYPEVAMTSASQGGYVVTPSTQNATHVAYHMFDGDRSTRWTAQGSTDSYDSLSPYQYNGSNSSSISDTSGTPHDGAFLKLELPTAIKLDYTIIRENTDPATRTPGKITFLGSTNGTDWTFLKEFSGMSNTALDETYIINDTNYYNHFAFVVKNLSDGDGVLDLGEWELYGYEEGDASLDTTLKSVYNVPATTGTQLEVYYDAKDLADGALSTTSGAISGLGGTAVNGTAYGDPQVSNGAFVFDGTGDYISGTLPSSVTGEWVHSMSMWFKASNYANENIIFIGNVEAGNGRIAIAISSTGLLTIGISGSNVQYASATPVDYGWHHLTYTYAGGVAGAGATGYKLYVDGVNITQTGGVGSGTLNLPTGPNFFLGSGLNGGGAFNGSIANFRLYSKVLNADQVKELYDYQKDYFLGSKSQVTLYKGHLGVGVTEPSGQLELAGDERIQEYPPGPMDDYETLIPGHGVFCAYASSGYTNGSTQNRFAYNAFDKASGSGGLNDIWQSVDSLYNGGSGTNQPYTGSVRLAENLPKGHYLGLKMPYPVKITSFVMGAFFNSGYRAVGDGLIVGRNTNNPTWEVVHTLTNSFMAGVNGFNIATNAPAILITTPSIPIDNTKYYDEYALVVTGTLGSTLVTVSEWKLFGTPGPTTLDKGSLTLGRSLDVPRISRYDVDTETPRPEKLVVDFDTTVNSSPTDISGKGNHGTFNGGASYSPADKAFVFDGTDDVIYNAGIGNWSDNISHTFSWWFKCESVGAGNYGGGLVTLYNTVSTVNHYSAFSFETGSSGQINFYHFGNDISYNYPFELNRWYHVAGVYSGSSTTQKVYVDGVDLGPGTVAPGSVTTALILGTSPKLSLGGDYSRSDFYFDGQISNFKLYNVALEPSEVQKLYRLGRTGRSMVISDTAVGIGKVPEANLDVRGVANFGSRVGIGTTNPLTPLHVNGRIKAGSIGLAQVGNFSLYSKKVGRNNGNVSFTFDIPYTGNWQPGYFIIRAALNDTNSGDSYGWSYGASFRTYLDANYDLVSTIEGANPGATFFETSRSGGVITITALAAGRDFVTATCELLSYAGIEND